jgi:hypothetical protein
MQERNAMRTRRQFLVFGTTAVTAILSARGARAQQTSATSGSAAATIGPVTLRVGLAVIQVQFNGTGHFAGTVVPATTTVGASGASPAPVPLFDRSGTFKASAATLIVTAGAYYAEVTSDGACQLLFQQPLPGTVSAAPQTSLAGVGNDVSSYFTVGTTVSTLSVHTSSSQLRAWLYHLDNNGGEAIQGGVMGADGRFLDLTAIGAQMSYPVTLPDSGPYLIAVNNVSPGDTWLFSFA